jgi:hypothetical protein
MKAKIILFSILINFSCYKKTDHIEPNNTKERTVRQINTDDRIVGEWQMCKSFDKGTEIAYNVCPIVTFFSNSTGIIEINDKNNHPFNFSQNKNKINLKFTSKEDLERFFSNISNFEYIIDEKENIITLKMIHGDYQWVLSRVKYK